MKELGAFQLGHDIQGADQLWQVMAIKRPDVMPAQLFKHRARRDHTLHVFFGPLGKIPGAPDVLEDFLGALAERCVGFARPNFGKVGSETARVVPDRHLVIVENDQHIGSLMAGVRQCLKCHAPGDGTITNNGNDLAIDTLALGC